MGASLPFEPGPDSRRLYRAPREPAPVAVLVLNSLASRTNCLAERLAVRLAPLCDVDLVDVSALRLLSVPGALVSRHGAIVIAKNASASTRERAELRRAFEAQGITFVDVHVASHLDAYIERDGSDWWSSMTSALASLTGRTAAPVPTAGYDLCVRADWNTIDAGAEAVIDALSRRGLVDGRVRQESA